MLLQNTGKPDTNAWAFGHALIEYSTQNLTIEQLRERFDYYLNKFDAKNGLSIGFIYLAELKFLPNS